MQAATRQRLSAADMSIVLSVERGLGALGEGGKQTILHHLWTAGMTVDDVPSNVVGFLGFLRALFGSGSVLVECEIETSLRLLEGLGRCSGSLEETIHELREKRA